MSEEAFGFAMRLVLVVCGASSFHLVHEKCLASTNLATAVVPVRRVIMPRSVSPLP